eukprot:RCo042146
MSSEKPTSASSAPAAAEQPKSARPVLPPPPSAEEPAPLMETTAAFLRGSSVFEPLRDEVPVSGPSGLFAPRETSPTRDALVTTSMAQLQSIAPKPLVQLELLKPGATMGFSASAGMSQAEVELLGDHRSATGSGGG